ncbi:MAG: uracil-DNA glycosylase [Sedimentisphaerales bacterium]|nr:uracil-DNA glycosylase [Sedimentisphaerales bacterium]
MNKAVRQHLEMADFFGGFLVKGKRANDYSPLQATEAGEVRSTPETAEIQPMSQSGKATTRDNPDATNVLEEIAAEVRKCCKCGLGSTRTHGVPGEGNPNARLMFVGEAPGADEDAQGRPFVGRAGQLLDKIVVACGLKRQDVFIGNILKCRPPDNRDPRPDEIISCLPYLQQQIEAIKPEIIVALGAHAARTLLDTNKSIGQLRGHFEEYYPGLGLPPIKLMATYHPAYILRNYTPDTRRKVWEDMKKVVAELGLPVPE